jgi:hypothetical protein
VDNEIVKLINDSIPKDKLSKSGSYLALNPLGKLLCCLTDRLATMKRCDAFSGLKLLENLRTERSSLVFDDLPNVNKPKIDQSVEVECDEDDYNPLHDSMTKDRSGTFGANSVASFPAAAVSIINDTFNIS